MHKSGWTTIAAMLFFAVATCSEARAQAAPAQTPAQPKSATGTTTTHKAPAASPYDRALLRPALLIAKAPATYQVKFTTTKGDFTLSVTRAWAPLGADRFYNLVRHHFYDGATFFRVLPGFMAQFGISAYPEVSKVWEHANIKDDPIVQSNHRGFVSFATAGPNTRTTQVFINYGNNEALDRSGFSAFAVVTNTFELARFLPPVFECGE